jgi:FAD/FMN-containing dehydrogenase
VGWLVRKCGLACDNLLSVDIVLADGQLHTASAMENDDLFWGGVVVATTVACRGDLAF